jgi:hypothetical protein
VKALLHARAGLADVEDFLLGLVQNGLDRLALGVEGVGGDLVAGGHQFSENGALPHNLGVAPHIGRTRHVLGQRVEVHQATCVLGLALALQVLKNGDDVGRLAGVDQGADGRVNELVLMAVKVAVHQQITHPVPGAVVQQQAPQHAGLALNGMRGNAQLRNLLV